MNDAMTSSPEWRDIKSAPKDGALIWVYLYQTGIRLVVWKSPHELAAEDGGSPEEYDGLWCEVNDGREWWEPHWWLPYEAIPTPPEPSKGRPDTIAMSDAREELIAKFRRL